MHWWLSRFGTTLLNSVVPITAGRPEGRPDSFHDTARSGWQRGRFAPSPVFPMFLRRAGGGGGDNTEPSERGISGITASRFYRGVDLR
jgi:hypothetical protein